MNITICTHNLFYHRAFADAEQTAQSLRPDILCFQEFEMNQERVTELEMCGYRFAGFSHSFVRNHKVFSVATFYLSTTFSSHLSHSILLPRTRYETFLHQIRGIHSPRMALKTTFTLPGGKSLIVYNLHLTALAFNGGRAKQLIETFDDVARTSDEPLVIAGDFNFPYRRKQLQTLFESYDLHEATHSIRHTFDGRLLKILPMKLKDDYILFKNIALIKTWKAPSKISDHQIVISRFHI